MADKTKKIENELPVKMEKVIYIVVTCVEDKTGKRKVIELQGKMSDIYDMFLKISENFTIYTIYIYS